MGYVFYVVEERPGQKEVKTRFIRRPETSSMENAAMLAVKDALEMAEENNAYQYYVKLVWEEENKNGK